MIHELKGYSNKPSDYMDYQQILNTAIQNFNSITSFQMSLLPTPFVPNQPTHTKQAFDGHVQIIAGEQHYVFAVNLKNEIRESQLASLIQVQQDTSQHCLLICQYISKPLRKILRQNSINYLDASGNCSITQGSLILFVNDQKVAPQRLSNTSQLWKPTGLRLIFSLLLMPELINETYRTIAQKSNLSLGTIGILLQQLEKENYFTRQNNHYQIQNRSSLLNRFIETYPVILRPKLIRGKFRFQSPAVGNNWRNVFIAHSYWGGEPAGAVLTGFLHPEKFTLYSNLPTVDIMKQLKLVPANDTNAELEVVEIFWQPEDALATMPPTVPPLLAYAELATSFDSRNRETAERIKNTYSI